MDAHLSLSSHERQGMRTYKAGESVKVRMKASPGDQFGWHNGVYCMRPLGGEQHLHYVNVTIPGHPAGETMMFEDSEVTKYTPLDQEKLNEHGVRHGESLR